MAGERSKSIGEVGESIAENFFKKIGWGKPAKGVYFPCYNKKEHALKESKSGEKNVHGIDFLVSYKSALESETLNNLLISVKHLKDSKYPKSATDKFKGYIRDLVHSSDCFKISPLCRETVEEVSACKSISNIPVLFIISSNDDENYDFIRHISSSRFIYSFDVKELYVVDNRKVSFVLSVIDYLEREHKDYDWYFYYPMTGMNMSDSNIHHHGKKLQIEFLVSPFIPFLLKKKIGEDETYKFFIASIDKFNKDGFAKLVSYCRANTNDNIRDVEIAFDDYFYDDNSNDIRKILNKLDFDLNLKVANYSQSFRRLAGD